jgi:hypothetical protein
VAERFIVLLIDLYGVGKYLVETLVRFFVGGG